MVGIAAVTGHVFAGPALIYHAGHVSPPSLSGLPTVMRQLLLAVLAGVFVPFQGCPPAAAAQERPTRAEVWDLKLGARGRGVAG